MRFRLVVDGEPHTVEVERGSKGLEVRVDGARYAARVVGSSGTADVRIGRSRHRVELRGTRILLDGLPHEVSVDLDEAGAAGASGERGREGRVRHEVRPPMPGRVVRIAVAPGGRVRKGQPVAVLEAMKMQNEVPAPWDGVVVEVRAREGETVGPDDVIAVLESS